MKLHNDVNDLIAKSKELENKIITGIKLKELKWEGSISPAYFTELDQVLSLDFSVIIYTDSSDIYEFTWDGSFFQYGVGIIKNSLNKETNAVIWDISNNSEYDKFINKKIINTEILWEEEWYLDDKGNILNNKKYKYPQSIVLSLDNAESIVISTAQLNSNTKEIYANTMSDNILIIFNKNTAKKLKLIA